MSIQKTAVWDLDEEISYKEKDCHEFMRTNGYDKGKHDKFTVGQQIEFFTGYNDDIRAKATIKGIDGNDLYIYEDCYWFPIQDNEKTKISSIKE